MSKVPSRHRTAGQARRPVLALLLLAAAAADSLTMLALPIGAELNPFAASYPWLALTAKGFLALALVLWPWRWGTHLQAFGALMWGFGALTNIVVLVR